MPIDGDVLERDAAAVDEARLPGEADPDDAPARARRGRRPGRGRRPSWTRRPRRRTAGPAREPAGQTCSNPSDAANRADGSRRATRWTSTPRALAMSATSSPIVPAPTTSSRSPASTPAASTRAPGVAAGLDHRPRRVVDRVGERVERRRRHRQLLGQRARPAVADPDLEPVRAQVLAPRPAPVAAPAAEHRVAGHATPEPGGVDAGTDGGHGAAPLVPDPERVGRLARVQVGHLAAEQLDVRAAHADPRDVDDDLARRRRPVDRPRGRARAPVPR